jgi:tetratricopeptide (TPR) repeat protein
MSTGKAIVLLSAMLLSAASTVFSQTPPTHQQQIESHKAQAQAYLSQNRPDLAAGEFKAIVALEPNNADARGNLGVLLFFQGAYADAVPQLRAALKLQPTLWKIQALLGMAEKRTGDVSSALADLSKAFPKVKEQKIRIDTGMELIEIYSAAGELDKAATTVNVLRELDPTNVEIIYTAYRIYSDLVDESRLSLSVAGPNSARMHQMMAHELARQGRTDEAIANYRQALAINPNLPGLHFELAEMLNNPAVEGGPAEAEKEYKAALAMNSFDEKSECRLGEIAALRGDQEEASTRYARALQLQPNDPEANIGMAKVLMFRNQTEKAEALLKHAIELDPTSSLAHYRLSTIYRQTGRVEDAKREVEEYQKYKDMKEKLRDIYRPVHLEPDNQEPDSAHTHN